MATDTSKENSTPSTMDNGDASFSLKVKPEFILKERASSLPPLPSPVAEDARGDERDNGDGDDRDANRQRRKKKRGQNKKRPRDIRQDDSEKICMAIMRGDVCPYNDGCRFSHDVKAYMATRPADIAEVEGGCPNFINHGFCMYGAMCRVGGNHITKTGENVTQKKSDEVSEQENGVIEEIEKIQSKCPTVTEKKQDEPKTYERDVVNHLTKDLQIQLRKNKYPFLCKRHYEKDSKASAASSSSTPIDKLKTRKLIDFSNKVYVAPLTTVGNLPFRRIMKDYDADITCGEMAVVTNLLEGKASEWALLKRHKCEDVFGIQLAAAHPDQYTRVSELIEKYTDVDFVDLNLGCPLDLLCNKGAGAALMMREHKLKGALEGMSANMSCSITVKMRTGWDMNKPFAHQLVPKIQSWGIDGLAAVMIHGRSRLQRYKSEANWEYISSVQRSASSEHPMIPVIGNGDIFSYAEYEEKVLGHPNLSQTAMLGRGALIKPWLPREIKEKRNIDISASERLDILKSFVRYGLEHWGSDQQGVNNTRRFLLEWLSFLHRYVPVGLLEVLPQKMNQRPPPHMMGRNDLETLFMSPLCSDWIKISEMVLGPVPEDFQFEPKHKANSYNG
ncbi:tRNA-dihydrouridine synthase B [Nitzschia inconspicua]|uniref:tRNA-dihydrouridine(47) synthase [NAD(P)(+)] n=1 Tax=Nitzschia inconspicua TaxID=303405 RepID=A0A9K3KXL3_9STRA|nr:tRNA-dihydrouridine synthase B [Nitzschia inconspicua]